MEREELRKAAAVLKLGQNQRHVFLCTGPTCCSPEQGLATWEHLKRRLKETGLADGQVLRTKVGCLRICNDGPTAVIYPEGTWYHGVTPAVCDRIVDEHLLRNQPVSEYHFATAPLQGNAPCAPGEAKP